MLSVSRRFKRANRWVKNHVKDIAGGPFPLKEKKTQPVRCPFFDDGFSSTQVTLADEEAFDNPGVPRAML